MSKELNCPLGMTGLTVTAQLFTAGIASGVPIVCVDIGNGHYQGDMAGAAGTYQVHFLSASALRAFGEIIWDGAAEVTANTANTVKISGTSQTARDIGASVIAASVAGLTVANLDVAVSTRLAAAGYTAPDNATISAIAGFVDTEIAAIKAQTDKFTFTGSLVNSHTDNWGVGAISWTYTVTNATTGLPIADVDVWVTSDSAGTNVLASGKTNSSGIVAFYLDAGTVYVFRQKAGYNFLNPDQEVIA